MGLTLIRLCSYTREIWTHSRRTPCAKEGTDWCDASISKDHQGSVQPPEGSREPEKIARRASEESRLANTLVPDPQLPD